jgi:hypothetical protein
MYGFLYVSYGPTAWCWASAETLRKLLLTAMACDRGCRRARALPLQLQLLEAEADVRGGGDVTFPLCICNQYERTYEGRHSCCKDIIN